MEAVLKQFSKHGLVFKKLTNVGTNAFNSMVVPSKKDNVNEGN